MKIQMRVIVRYPINVLNKKTFSHQQGELNFKP